MKDCSVVFFTHHYGVVVTAVGYN